jgi:hypothetical protein
MSPRLWYLSEDAGEKLEDVEGLPLGIAGQRVVVGRLAFIEESAGAFCPVNARERQRASEQVACEPLEAVGILRPDGGRAVHRESAISEGIQQLDALVAQKAFTLEQSERFVPKQPFGGSGIDVRYGKPSSVGVPDSSGSKAMEMWVWVDETSEALRHGDDSGSSVLVVDGLRHQLVNGLIGEPSEIGEKLPVVHEIRPKHLGESEGEQLVAYVFEKLVFEKGGERGGPLGVAGRADAALFAAQCQ